MRMKLIKSMLFLAIVSFFVACSDSGKNENSATDNKGRKIVETGELNAIDVRAFVLQRYGQYWYRMKIIGLLKQGENVEKGDSVIQLDASEIKKYIVDRETELETQRAAISKLLVDQSNQRSQLESNLKNELAGFDLKKLELQATRFESDKTQKIKQLEFKQAEINIKKVQRQVELNQIVARNEMLVQRIREKQLLTELKSARDILPTLTIRTPIKGIFQVGQNNRNGQTLKIGDEIYIGNMMGSVPDLTWMKVNTCVNENDFLRVKVGQKVKVRLDALPKVVFDGEISYVGKLCHLKDEKSKQKVFDVEVKMLKSDERLKPGMTVSCEYVEK